MSFSNRDMRELVRAVVDESAMFHAFEAARPGLVVVNPPSSGNIILLCGERQELARLDPGDWYAVPFREVAWAEFPAK